MIKSPKRVEELNALCLFQTYSKACHSGVQNAWRKSQWLFLSEERAVAPGYEVESRNPLLYFFSKVLPAGIHSFNQCYLFLTSPVLQLFLSANSILYIMTRFEVYKFMDMVQLGKPVKQFVFVLIYSSGKIICHTDIKSCIPIIG